MCNAAIEVQGEKKRPRNTKPKLAVWNLESSQSLKNLRTINKQRKEIGSKNDPLFAERKHAKKEFSRLCRISTAKKLTDEKQEIIGSRSSDMKLFY
ncbi:hypothetical protein DPMN_012605 [Dreissena polymorpha]|uniref:Uncharacterized protein n=1 Tax=Dreissena polymorpha TaxID=45954 RepID=A0A9D4N8B7_DREPO|nr:hypothetical protein DPMN_012605 [Dreissena polymorpha]